MGGLIAVGALAEGTVAPLPTVLTAPMFGIAMPLALRAGAWATLKVAGLLGRADRWPPLGDAATPYPLSAPFETNVLTGDREVYDWLVTTLHARPELGLGMPSIRWFAAAWAEMHRVRSLPPPRVPLLSLVGSAERVVDVRAVESGIRRLGGRLVRIPNARHEPLVDAPAPRAAAWAAIDAFLLEQGL